MASSGIGERLSRHGARAALALLCLWLGPGFLRAQLPESVSVHLPDNETVLPIENGRGYPAIPAASLRDLGWTDIVDRVGGEVMLRHRTGLELEFRPGSPLFEWDGQLIQMAEVPYWTGEEFYVPLQLAVDLFPGLLPDAYEFDEDLFLLLAEVASPLELRDADPSDQASARAGRVDATRSDLAPPPWSTGAGGNASTVVIIDPGHGGDDPGALGPGRLAEKDVALSLGLALARQLANNPSLEVRLTRDRDVAVPIWSRGEWATEWKGDRRGVFISIHANALPDRDGIRGFETYFLSEARTEHERRVAAAENAGLPENADSALARPDPLLSGILTDLRALDHLQWSALLADQVQRELSEFHPGPDRGVKQGPFAVITNSLMPSVLVEIGFITNPEEERLLARDDFHREAARAMARAVERFLERYPAGGAG